MSKKVLSEDLICHGSSELSMHNFLSSLGTWQGVKNAMPWKEKKLGKKTTGKDYLKRCSTPSSGTKVAKYRSIFQPFSISEVSVRLDSDYCFLFPNHKKIMNSFPYYILLVEGEVFEQCVIFSKNILKSFMTKIWQIFCLCWTIFLHSITLLSFLLSSSSFEAIQKKHFSCRVITHAQNSSPRGCCCLQGSGKGPVAVLLSQSRERRRASRDTSRYLVGVPKKHAWKSYFKLQRGLRFKSMRVGVSPWVDCSFNFWL